MKTKYIAALMLMLLGILVLTYSGIAFTIQGQPLDYFGPHRETTERHTFPAMVGVLPLIGGIIALVANSRQI